jgi:hypothetical protein
MCAKNVPPPPLRVSATFWDTMGGRIVGKVREWVFRPRAERADASFVGAQ